MRDRFTIKEGDLSPALDVQLVDQNNDPIDLTNASVTFVMKEVRDDAPAVESAATIVDAATGDVKYEWSDGDTDDPGIYEAEFEVEYADLTTETVPSDGYVYVMIRKKLST